MLTSHLTFLSCLSQLSTQEQESRERKSSSIRLPCHIWAAIRAGHWVAYGHQGFPALCCPEPFKVILLMHGLRRRKKGAKSGWQAEVSEKC